ncbi:helix-turn-helix transcriptional regulator [Pseudomonas aeruginosa]|uniref:AraC family transcriptional regulator n=1 Tax=Pseudomonas aeruginosa TaxID=287 RepID=UPI001596F3E5|nr:helix-turn-helix transcriptional regulator [Pseudomonas aeruginosa]MBH4114817.1 helix-turn-helix transcriptional regulator [Pseudomonas aeruginosa]HCF3941573.1 helix-turn-helix transcriptional regulator [Pseudomonas aeruginosa]
MMKSAPFDPDLAPAPVVGVTENWQPGGVPFHHHQRHQLMYSIKGVMHVITSLGRWVLPPSRAIWISQGTDHTFMAKRPVALHILYVDPQYEQVPMWGDCAVVNVTPLVRELVAASVQLPWDYPADSHSSRLVRVLLEELQELPHAPVNLPEPRDPRGRKVVAALRADPSLRYSLTELAAMAAASPRTLERIFQNETGISLSEWQTRSRLLSALELLAEGTPVANAGAAVGYTHPSSFIAAFRGLFGTTPGNYFK